MQNSEEGSKHYTQIASLMKPAAPHFVFQRTACYVFGDNKLKESLPTLDVDDAEAMKAWKTLPHVQSCTARLQTLFKHLRIRASAISPGKDFKAPSCALKPKIAQEVLGSQESNIPDAISNPTAMPVHLTDKSKLEPFFDYISSLKLQPNCDVEFKMGALLKGGHLDMCKQVVGPAHLSSLCQAVAKPRKPVIEHFLLGNNVCFEDPAKVTGAFKAQASESTRKNGLNALLEIMQTKYGIKTWYLAGNCISGDILERMRKVLEDNTVCEALWLKRNPVGTDGTRGPAALGRLLAHNKTLQVLDLHNTGLLDGGIMAMDAAERDDMSSGTQTLSGSVLHWLDLSANGITANGAHAVANLIARHLHTLESLLLDINRLGDEGVAVICDALKGSKVLKRLSVGSNRLTDVGLARVCKLAMEIPSLILLNVGHYLSTWDLGEKGNVFSDVSPLLEVIRAHPNIQLVKIEKCGLDHKVTCEALIEEAKKRGTVAVYANQRRFKFGYMTYIPLDDDALRLAKQPKIVDHIYSIYRNNM
ncbi:hypothetical protein HDV05_006863 [Chytridiales sp. JEL 0842]|nr:hypothetical protein HDV05_006863 [Chytridiales sp. JEL 0842]